MRLNEMLGPLDNLLNKGRTAAVLRAGLPVCSPNSYEFKEAAQENRADMQALVGMAYYRRGEFDEARMWFDRSLALDPANERALYGMAYLAAAVDKDPDALRFWTDKMPEGAARDNARMIMLRDPEYVEKGSLIGADGEVGEILLNRIAPNPQDPINTANLLWNAARFYLEYGDEIAYVCAGDPFSVQSDDFFVFALSYLTQSIGLYGMGNMNLHHRAAAYHWMSVAQEKLFGSTAAIPFACEALRLWLAQLDLDPANPHFIASCENTYERLYTLFDIICLPLKTDKENTYLNDLYTSAVKLLTDAMRILMHPRDEEDNYGHFQQL